MTCVSARSLAGAYLDDELEASLSIQVREHLASCSSCAEEHAQNLMLRTDIREHAPYYRAPASLHDRVRKAVRQAAGPVGGHWRWIAIAAGLLLAVSAAWNVILLRPHEDGANSIATSVLSSHVRSLMGTHLLDVPSSDQHTVKPWFNGKLDFAPEVRDFAAQGFPLIGGRIDFVEARPVAALVYQRRKHIVNLFTWPSSAPGDNHELSRNGYHFVQWVSAGMTYWAVSDVSPAELREFARLYGH